MLRITRPRRYVSPMRLYVLLPALRYSHARGAYVLRFVGETRGPVLRKDRRRGRLPYAGPERRLDEDEPLLDPALTSRPAGGVRVLTKTSLPNRPAAQGSVGSDQPDATRHRPQHGRQRPPRPRH